MTAEIEVMDFLRGVFADGKVHSSGELCELLYEKFGFTNTKAMRRVMSLVTAGEIQKIKRGYFQKVIIQDPKEQLYKVYSQLREVIELSHMPEIDVSEFPEEYRQAVVELILIWNKVREVVNRLETEEEEYEY